jgi:hypothetical protein
LFSFSCTVAEATLFLVTDNTPAEDDDDEERLLQLQILSFGSPPRLFLLLPFSLLLILLLLVRLLSFSVIYKRRSIDRSWLTRWRRTREIAGEKPTDEDSFTHGNHGLPTQVHALHNESRGWNLDEVCVYRQNWAFLKIFPKTPFFLNNPPSSGQ